VLEWIHDKLIRAADKNAQPEYRPRLLTKIAIKLGAFTPDAWINGHSAVYACTYRAVASYFGLFLSSLCFTNALLLRYLLGHNRWIPLQAGVIKNLGTPWNGDQGFPFWGSIFPWHGQRKRALGQLCSLRAWLYVIEHVTCLSVSLERSRNSTWFTGPFSSWGVVWARDYINTLLVARAITPNRTRYITYASLNAA